MLCQPCNYIHRHYKYALPNKQLNIHILLTHIHKILEHTHTLFINTTACTHIPRIRRTYNKRFKIQCRTLPGHFYVGLLKCCVKVVSDNHALHFTSLLLKTLYQFGPKGGHRQGTQGWPHEQRRPVTWYAGAAYHVPHATVGAGQNKTQRLA